MKTPFGYHPIEDLTVEHPIISGQGNYRHVLATHARDYDGMLVEIHTRKIRRPVQLTADHKVFAVRPTARHERRYKYFSKRFRTYLRRYPDDPGYYFRKIAKWLPIREIEASELRVGDLVLYPINDRVSPVESVNLEDYVSKRGTRGPRPPRLPVVPVSDDFLRLLGYFIAEGSTHRAHVRFSLGGHEEAFADEIVGLIRSLFGIRAAIHRRHTSSSVDITACHAALANAFANLCGRTARGKHIPFVFQELPSLQKRILIEAIARGDGTQRVASRSSRISRSITTVSPVLAEQFVDYLLALGSFPGVHLRKARRDSRGVKHQASYAIQWSEEARPRYDLVYRSVAGTRYWLLPVERVRRLKYRGPVYNLTVERDHSYVVSHISVANCGRGGDVFDFMMAITNQPFPEALAALAERAGIPLERTEEETRDRSEREQILRALDAAAAFYRASLAGPSGAAARDYLTRRGVRPETVERFGLGYAPTGWDGLLRALAAKGYDAAVLDRAGLVQARAEGGGHFDLLRHRLIFPIEDLQDRTVAFGGRALHRESTPKYLNSRESAAFQKGRLLYLLNRAREAIRETGAVVVVEGYMDALACHQAGVRNAVATLGTALTLDHVLLLKRFAGRAVLVYDADAAGRLASERGAQLFEEAELPAAVAVLPAGADPDAFLRREGPEKFRTILDDALSMFDYQVQLAELRHDAKTLEGKVAIADELLPVVLLVLNPVRQSEYLRAIAQRFDLSEEALRQRLASRRRSDRRGSGESMTGMAPPTPARWKAERFLLHLMVQEAPARDAVRDELVVDDFLDPLHRKLVQVLWDEDAPAETLRERLPDQESAELLNRLLFEPLGAEEKDRDKVQADSIEFFRTERLREERRRIQQALKEAQAAGDEAQVTRLQSDFLALREREQGGSAERQAKGGEEHGAEKGAGP